MKITSIVVDGVGKFGTRTEVVGLGSGVNILAAGNEEGKSTVFRAVRACLLERHNARNEIIKALVTEGLSLPVSVTLGFELDSSNYTISKSFWKSPAASLTKDGVEIARGREADERLWDLLGISPGSGRSVDESAFGILWVGQGQSFKAPEPSAAASSVLNSAIQAEVGSLVGGERARSVLQALNVELGQLVTNTGRPKAGSPYADAVARRDDFKSELERAEQRLSVLDHQLSDLEGKQRKRAQQSDPALLAEMTTDLQAARESKTQGEAAAALLVQFENAERQSRAALEIALNAKAELEDRVKRIESSRTREGSLRRELEEKEPQVQAAREEADRLRLQAVNLDAQILLDDDRLRALQTLSVAVSQAKIRASLATKRTALQTLGERIVRNAGVLAKSHVTAGMLTSLDDLERDISLLTARLEAAAPEVTVRLGASGAGVVSMGGAVLATNVVQSVVDPVVIAVGDLASITVTPPRATGTGDLKKRQDAERRLLVLLESAGVESPAELRTARAARVKLEGEMETLRAELNMYGISEASPALAIEAAKTEIEAIDVLVSETLMRLKLASLPSAEAVARDLDGLQTAVQDARRGRQALQGSIDAQNAILVAAGQEKARIGGMLTQVELQLNTDLAVLPDVERAARIATAEAAVGAAQSDFGSKAAALQAQRQTAPSADELARREIRVKRLESSLEAQKDQVALLDRDIANLEGQIQNAGGDGLGQKVEELRQSHAVKAREVEKYEGRLATLVLLKDTVDACFKEQKDRLDGPLRRHLKPFLNDVFPSADIELGDGFSIAGIKRNGPDAESFERLSAGTQEQISVLVRLAMGAMLCERGGPVPIILDDALVFSDDGRIEQMFDALNRAGMNQQLIVLTCRTRTFSRLGGRQLSLVRR
jgi:chromosome segregation ATPase